VSTARRLLIVIGLGLALGAATQVLQGILPGPLGMLANGLSPWLLSAFALGAAMPTPRWAALSGPLLLLMALVGYYLLVQLRFGYGGSKSALIVWGVSAIVGGPLFAFGGWAWHHAERPWVRGTAAGLAGGLVLMEAFYTPAVAGYSWVAPIWAAFGVLLPVLLGRTGRERLIGLATMVPWDLLGLLGLVVVASVQLLISEV
jgi:hypothetical protein